ncbi:MAG: SAM-dependent methyltransferase, partial [Alphaproteobacteria bacterium]|nr:SAM-dependent methyltransferase [Alphaproteobacteria bacterium]
SVAEYMAEALGHPEFGYYMGKDPLGAAGDFITAPEISQMFGELIGLWCANSWLALGKPTPFVLAELGPGRGTLMADALRALETVAACRAAVQVHLVETSPHLRERQRQALPGIDATWHDNVVELPMLPAVFIANEFFDALPVEQFARLDGGWHRRLIGLGANDVPEFVFTHDPEPYSAEYLPSCAEDGAIAESSPATLQIAHEIGRRVRSHSSAALIIDYGYAGPAVGDTLQAVHRHEYAAVLEQPGQADLTAHVDFGALAASALAAGAGCWGEIGQGEFLRRLGIETRAATLMAEATPAQRIDIETAFKRLIDADQMGTLFKVLAIGPRTAGPPAGFVSEEARTN